MQLSRRVLLRWLGNLMAIVPLWPGNVADSALAASPQTLDAATRAMLARLCARLVPLAGISDRSVHHVVDALDAQAAREPTIHARLVEGCVQARVAGGDSAAPSDCELDAYLTAVATTPFFATVHGTAVSLLVNDHDVWGLVGYEGESLTKGGYLNRGFADLDWLPAPPADVMGKIE